MQNQNGLTPGEQELEVTLKSLIPSQANLGRDEVMFQAGRASLRRRYRFWQGTCSVLTVLLSVSLFVQYRYFRGEDIRPIPPAMANIQRPSPEAPAPYLRDHVPDKQVESFRQHQRIRRDLLDQGIDALPVWKVFHFKQSMLPLTRDSLDDMLSSG